jgi:hypothetical protein
MLNSDDEQDNQSKKRDTLSTLPMQSEEIKESLGIKSGGGPVPAAAAGSKLQDDYMRLCQMSGGNGTTINNNKTKVTASAYPSTMAGK